MEHEVWADEADGAIEKSVTAFGIYTLRQLQIKRSGDSTSKGRHRTRLLAGVFANDGASPYSHAQYSINFPDGIKKIAKSSGI